jgi:glycosyltransferase involved in cell wall biosynthesis
LPPPDIDVVIPTIGRKKYLSDFLQDLANQTILPKNVIVVEQNPQQESISELDYLQTSWPFAITHIFTHETGACQARNKALEHVKASWVFLADDDIRIGNDFLELAYKRAVANGNEVYNFSCVHPGQKSALSEEHQTFIFGAGCSMLTRRSLGDAAFNLSYEFGFSEDLEFARQLADKGYDTCFLPQPEVLHLKAPVGGFRTKIKQIWDEDPIQPKPAPTVLLFKIDHHTRAQLLGYRTMLFFKFYFNQSIRNPFKYLHTFKERWRRSIYYANHLKAGQK